MMRTREPGTGERLAPHDLLGQAELLADRAHLVLEQVAQRLDELEVHVVGEPADVVVRLDRGVVAAARLDDVGVERALHEEPRRRRQVARDLLEHPDERLADDLALPLGLDDVVERAEEPVGRLHVHEVDLELAPERLLHLLGLAEPQQAGVDEHARELVADRLVHERGRDRGVDAARQPADHPLVADLRADLVDGLLDDRRVRPRGPALAHVEQERA